MRVLVFSPGPPSRSDALLRQFTSWLSENGCSIGWRYFGAYKEYEPADIVLTVGWNHTIAQIHRDQIATGKPSLSISDGFLRRGWAPGSYFAMTRNGLHAYGDQIGSMPGDRWSKLKIKLRPWQDNKEGHILLAHQHVDTWDGHSRQPWFTLAIERLKKITGREIVLRPHPRDKSHGALPKGCLISNRSFREDLEGAWAVVTYDSNMVVEALLHGVSAFTQGKTKADPLACRDLEQIETPQHPDRQQWAHDLAYCQWSVNELRAGLPFMHLIDNGLASPVDVPAVEADYEYASTWETLSDALTDWNVKSGQTPADVIREIANPALADAISARRDHFLRMEPPGLVEYLTDKGIKANIREAKELLVGRCIHASM